jgi:serine/threonine-protein kinase HipA
MGNNEKILSVRLNGNPVGILEQDYAGKMNFTYSEEAQQALSLSLPIRKEVFTDKECSPYFGGLLPEGDNARVAIARKYGANPRNDFSLLKAIGYDCAGAVSFHNPDEAVHPVEYRELKGKFLSEKKLAEYINDLPRKPLFLEAEGLRLSLAGAQDKAAVCLIDNEISIPIEGSPTTHILKPAIKNFDETVENEYICLKVANSLGIKTPDVEIRSADGIKYLLIQRYDRHINTKGLIKRIHQEDFCQALGIATAYKYQSHGGAGLNQCYDLLKNVYMAAIDRNQFTERIVFNYLIGNTDAHCKNFSLLHYEQNKTVLAPAYDILSTAIYSDLSTKMAMKIGGHYDIFKILPRHWEKLSKETGYSYPQLKKIIKKQSENILPAIEKELKILEEKKLSISIGNKILKYSDSICKKLQREFGF